MKLKWMVLCAIGLLAIQARAEESIVIDMDTLKALGHSTDAARPTNQISSPAAATVQTPAAAGTSAVSGLQGSEPNADEDTTAQARSIRDRMLKSGKMSAREQMAMSRIKAGEQNLESGAAFQAANKARPGVVTLTSGVQYRILRVGKGRKPAQNSLVLCRYRGTLIDGTEFESTGAKGPMYFYVSAFLPGLQQALKLMPSGSKWEIVVPPELGYRDLGNRLVGPNATLIYEMELIEIK